jgi:thioredoxin 1
MAVTALTQENFKETIQGSKLPVMVDFYADWCQPCRRIAPLIEEISNEMPDKVFVCKFNVDEGEEISREFNIRSIPYVMCFKNGQPYKNVIGSVPKDELLALLK